MIAHKQGDAQAAMVHLRTSQEHGEQAALIDWPFRWRLAQARIEESSGNWEIALDLLDAAERRYLPNPIPATDALSYRREFEHLTLARAHRPLSPRAIATAPCAVAHVAQR